MIEKPSKEFHKLLGIWKGETRRKPIKTSIKNEILHRQNGRCCHCGERFYEEGKAPCIHHLDGNRNNNSINNLQAVCHDCHGVITHQQIIDQTKQEDEKEIKRPNKKKPLNEDRPSYPSYALGSDGRPL